MHGPLVRSHIELQAQFCSALLVQLRGADDPQLVATIDLHSDSLSTDRSTGLHVLRVVILLPRGCSIVGHAGHDKQLPYRSCRVASIPVRETFTEEELDKKTQDASSLPFLLLRARLTIYSTGIQPSSRLVCSLTATIQLHHRFEVNCVV